MLGWIRDLKEFTKHLARWRLRLLGLNFEVRHRPRMYHQAADAMFWLPNTNAEESVKVTDNIFILKIRWNDTCESTELCKATNKLVRMPDIIAQLLEQERALYCYNLEKLIGIDPPRIYNEAELLCQKAFNNEIKQVATPSAMQRAVLYNAQYPKLAGHSGVRKLYSLLRNRTTGHVCLGCAQIHSLMRIVQTAQTFWQTPAIIKIVFAVRVLETYCNWYPQTASVVKERKEVHRVNDRSLYKAIKSHTSD